MLIACLSLVTRPFLIRDDAMYPNVAIVLSTGVSDVGASGLDQSAAALQDATA